MTPSQIMNSSKSYSEYKKRMDEYYAEQTGTRKVQRAVGRGLDVTQRALSPGKVEKSNIRAIQRPPQTILSKEQAMLSALFNQKNQLWGNGQPVRITRHLTTGGGLIKTGTGDETRRLLF